MLRAVAACQYDFFNRSGVMPLRFLRMVQIHDKSIGDDEHICTAVNDEIVQITKKRLTMDGKLHIISCVITLTLTEVDDDV